MKFSFSAATVFLVKEYATVWRSCVPVIIAGRRIGQAEAVAQEIRQAYPAANGARKRWT